MQNFETGCSIGQGAFSVNGDSFICNLLCFGELRLGFVVLTFCLKRCCKLIVIVIVCLRSWH